MTAAQEKGAGSFDKGRYSHLDEYNAQMGLATCPGLLPLHVTGYDEKDQGNCACCIQKDYAKTHVLGLFRQRWEHHALFLLVPVFARPLKTSCHVLSLILLTCM